MKIIVFLLSFTLMLLAGTAVFADPESISKQQAVEIATQSNPGKVLSVKRKANVYQVKILSGTGKVRIILVDAQTGTIESGTKPEK